MYTFVRLDRSIFNSLHNLTSIPMLSARSSGRVRCCQRLPVDVALHRLAASTTDDVIVATHYVASAFNCDVTSRNKHRNYKHQ